MVLGLGVFLSSVSTNSLFLLDPLPGPPLRLLVGRRLLLSLDPLHLDPWSRHAAVTLTFGLLVRVHDFFIFTLPIDFFLDAVVYFAFFFFESLAPLGFFLFAFGPSFVDICFWGLLSATTVGSHLSSSAEVDDSGLLNLRRPLHMVLRSPSHADMVELSHFFPSSRWTRNFRSAQDS